MKSKSLKVLVKGLIVAGAAFALAACDDNINSPVPVNAAEEDQLQDDLGENNPGQDVQGKGGADLDEQGQGNVNSSASFADKQQGVGSSDSGNANNLGLSSSDAATVVSSSSEAVEEGGIFLANDTDEGVDYMEVETIRDIEPCIRDYGNIRVDENGNKYCQILAYPKRLSDTKKHAVVVWGPGGGTAPGAYGGMINRLASHGFVVVALRESPGNGNVATEALNWLAEKNNTPGDPLYQKLDLTKVGCSGHSMGGLESEQALIKDERVITAMLNNSGDLGHSAMASVPTSKSIGIVYGEVGMEAPNAEADYNNYGVRAPACLIKMTGNNYGHGSGAWDGIPATVSWMRWHLGGEDFRKADFVGSSGKYINGPIYQWDWYQNKNVEKGHWYGQCKNFN